MESELDSLELCSPPEESTRANSQMVADCARDAPLNFFARELLTDRSYLIAAGLKQIVAYLEYIEFGDDAMDHLTAEAFDDVLMDWFVALEL